VRYVAEGEPDAEGAMPTAANASISAAALRNIPADAARRLSLHKGGAQAIYRSDLENAVTREFARLCGTHLLTRRPGLPAVILKAGTLDDPSLFGGPQMAIYTIDKQPFTKSLTACRPSSDCRKR